MSRREYEAINAAGPYRPQGSDALIALDIQGVVTTIDDEYAVTSDVVTRWTGGHSPGHQIVNVVSHGVDSTMLGHLALSSLHCAIGEFAGHVSCHMC